MTTKKQAATTEQADTPKADTPGAAKRKMLTPEQRVAALEMQLAEARAKAEAKNAKRIGELVSTRDYLMSKIADIQAKVDKVNLELDSLGHVEQPALTVVDDIAAES